MNAKPQPEQSVQEEQIRVALNRHWQASAAGDANAEHDIYELAAGKLRPTLPSQDRQGRLASLAWWSKAN